MCPIMNRETPSGQLAVANSASASGERVWFQGVGPETVTPFPQGSCSPMVSRPTVSVPPSWRLRMVGLSHWWLWGKLAPLCTRQVGFMLTHQFVLHFRTHCVGGSKPLVRVGASDHPRVCIAAEGMQGQCHNRPPHPGSKRRSLQSVCWCDRVVFSGRPPRILPAIPGRMALPRALGTQGAAAGTGSPAAGSPIVGVKRIPRLQRRGVSYQIKNRIFNTF